MEPVAAPPDATAAVLDAPLSSEQQVDGWPQHGGQANAWATGREPLLGGRAAVPDAAPRLCQLFSRLPTVSPPLLQAVKDLALQGNNLFVTGCGGSGKSYLIKHLIAHWEREGKEVRRGEPCARCCPASGPSNVWQWGNLDHRRWLPPVSLLPHHPCLPFESHPARQVALAALTGCAAELIGGRTLHSCLQMGVVTKVGTMSFTRLILVGMLLLLSCQVRPHSCLQSGVVTEVAVLSSPPAVCWMQVGYMPGMNASRHPKCVQVGDMVNASSKLAQLV